MNQAQETAVAIAADAIVAEPRNSRTFLERYATNVPDSVKKAFIKALTRANGLSDDELLDEAIRALRVSDQLDDVKAAGNILAWARNNSAHHYSLFTP